MAGRWKQSGVLIKDRYLEMRIEIKNDSTVQNLFTISKKTKSENPKITINFKDFKNTSSEIGFSKLNNDTIVLNGIKIFDYYRIENESASINEVKTIIWTDSKGLTAYQLKNRGWMTINYSKSIDKEALSV